MITPKKGIALAVVAYLLFLIATFPASYAIGRIEALIPKTIAISQVDGTIWQGDLDLVYGQDQFDVNWQIHPWKLVLMRVAVTFAVENDRLALRGHAHGGLNGVGINALDGYIGEQYIETIGSEFDVDLETPIRVRQLGLAYKRQFKDTAGGLYWGGGKVYYQAGRKRKEITLPPLAANITQREGNLLATASLEENSDAVLASLEVQPSGLLTVAVRKRALDLVGQKFMREVEGDFIVFESQEQLFNN